MCGPKIPISKKTDNLWYGALSHFCQRKHLKSYRTHARGQCGMVTDAEFHMVRGHNELYIPLLESEPMVRSKIRRESRPQKNLIPYRGTNKTTICIRCVIAAGKCQNSHMTDISDMHCACQRSFESRRVEMTDDDCRT